MTINQLLDRISPDCTFDSSENSIETKIYASRKQGIDHVRAIAHDIYKATGVLPYFFVRYKFGANINSTVYKYLPKPNEPRWSCDEIFGGVR